MCALLLFLFFFFNDTATTEIYTLSLHDALPSSTASAPLSAAPTTRTRLSASSRARTASTNIGSSSTSSTRIGWAVRFTAGLWLYEGRRRLRPRGPAERAGIEGHRRAQERGADGECGPDDEGVADRADRRPARPLADRFRLVCDREHGRPDARV